MDREPAEIQQIPAKEQWGQAETPPTRGILEPEKAIQPRTPNEGVKITPRSGNRAS